MNTTSIIDVSFEYGNNLQTAQIAIDKEIARRNQEGYEVVSLTPVTGTGYSYAGDVVHGISYTAGFIIVFKEM